MPRFTYDTKRQLKLTQERVLATRKWKREVSLFKDRASKEELLFIYSESEKRLLASIDQCKSVVERSIKLVPIVIGFLIAIVGLGINIFVGVSPLFNDMQFYLLLPSFYFFYIGRLLVKNILANLMFTEGNAPTRLFKKRYYTSSTSDTIRINKMYLSMIIFNQLKIDNNMQLASTKWHRYNIAMSLIILTPLAILVSCIATGLLLWVVDNYV